MKSHRRHLLPPNDLEKPNGIVLGSWLRCPVPRLQNYNLGQEGSPSSRKMIFKKDRHIYYKERKTNHTHMNVEIMGLRKKNLQVNKGQKCNVIKRFAGDIEEKEYRVS